MEYHTAIKITDLQLHATISLNLMNIFTQIMPDTKIYILLMLFMSY